MDGKEIGSPSVVFIAGGPSTSRVIWDSISKRFLTLGLGQSENGLFFEGRSSRIAESTTLLKLPFETGQGESGNPVRYINLVVLWVAASVFLMLELVRLRRRRFDLLISAGIQGALFGLFLKRVHLVKKLVFYKFDQFPPRRSNRLSDVLYNFLISLSERAIIRSSDEVWLMHRYYRATLGHLTEHKKIRVMPPLYRKRDILLATKENSSTRICYVGVVRKESGFQIIFEAMARLKNQGIEVIFEIIGKPYSPDYLGTLVHSAESMGIRHQVHFRGFIEDPDQVRLLMRNCLCGLAIFPGGNLNYSNLAITGKTREYLEGGLPVIISKSSIEAEDLRLSGCALVVDDSSDEIASCIKNLMLSSNLREIMRMHAIEYAQQRSDAASLVQAIYDVLSTR